jgi:drug/metabolite transporter (DMT)-like permease
MRHRFDPLTAAAMAVAVLSISATAPLTAAASASPLAMAFWRNALGFATLGPFLLLLRRREVARVARGERTLLRPAQWAPLGLGALAATALALHFAAFMTSTRLTTVAMSTALVATQPVWQALIAASRGVRASGRTWAGLGLAVAGAAGAAGLDINSGGTALAGDLLALGGAVAQAAYTALSQSARSDMSTPMYSTVCSLVCGLELFLVCRLTDVPLTGFDTSTQLSLLGLLVLPQLLGLGSLNFALGRASATTMSVLLLLETPVAAVTAWLLMGQRVQPASVPGLLLLIVGVMVVVKDGGGERAPAPQEPGTPYQPPYAPPPPAHASQGFPPFPSRLPEPAPWPAPPGPALTRTWPAAPTPTPPPPPPRPHVRDPRVAWAALEVDSPTLTLSYHGAGVFDGLPTARQRAAEQP